MNARAIAIKNLNLFIKKSVYGILKNEKKSFEITQYFLKMQKKEKKEKLTKILHITGEVLFLPSHLGKEFSDCI